MGRFITPDWAVKPIAVPYADFGNPQSLNLYAYVNNNPVTKDDPDGHGPWDWFKAGACVIGFSSACGPPPQQQGDPKSQLVNAQDKARNDPNMQRGAGGQATHCSEATCQIVRAVGAPDGPVYDSKEKHFRDANTQAERLASSSDYKEVPANDVQQLANQGKLVIAAWKNPDGHGHTATVRPKGVAGDKIHEHSKGPLINNIGKTTGVMGQNYAYGNNKEVHYYTPK